MGTKIRGFEHISDNQWEKDMAVEQEKPAIPSRGTARSAGYDVFSPFPFSLGAGEEIKVPTGFKAYMLDDEFLMLIPRSGLGFKYYTRLANTLGVGDSDYYNNEGNEGHYWVKIRNEGDKTLNVKSGDAIAQAIFQKYLLADGDGFNGEVRVGGFGSTGK